MYIASNEDLKPIAEKWTHHLYFLLVSCAQPNEASLFSGPVFAAAPAEQQHWLATHGGSGNFLYKIYVPIDRSRLVSHASVYGGLDVPAYMRSAKESGACFRLGGGDMAGFGLKSNLLPAPLAINDRSATVLPDQDGR